MQHPVPKARRIGAPALSAQRRATLLLRRLLPAAVLALAACSHTPRTPAPVTTPDVPPLGEAPEGSIVERPRGRWVSTRYADLPGWTNDRAAEFWPALRTGCLKPMERWATLCAEVLLTDPPSDEKARQWLETRLTPYRVESSTGETQGLITGYFEPLVDASRLPDARRRVPLYAAPSDLSDRKPYWTRKQLDTVPAARAALRGRELAYVEDPLDALILQIQGSGRLRLQEPDGSQRLVRLAFAGTNEHPYRSVGRWLIDQGEVKPSEASWPQIKDWARRHPKRVDEMLWVNPRYVFFRLEALPDPALGPSGAQGVPLTPGRSIAVDPQSVPYGTPVWLDATEPLSSQPLQRTVMAQDTGSAIVGAVRADYFWGWGPEAEAQAGRMKQPLRMWVLWPR